MSYRAFYQLLKESDLLSQSCGQLNYEVHIIRLHLSLVRRLVSYYGTASVAFVYDDIPLLRVRLCLDRTENSAATVCSVAGVYIHVQGAQAKRTVVARGISEGENLMAAVLAYEAVVVFCESFIFHIIRLSYDFVTPWQNKDIKTKEGT